jgi:hypothetical protein
MQSKENKTQLFYDFVNARLCGFSERTLYVVQNKPGKNEL